jgi:hypothetical protein
MAYLSRFAGSNDAVRFRLPWSETVLIGGNMLRTFALPVALAGIFAVAGGSVATQQLPPGYVDPKPILDAAVRAIGNDKLNCVTISGEGYNGAVGQQKEAGKNVDWPRPDKLANYTRTMNWQAKTMKEEFDRKPGLTPAAWKYGIGWLDGPIQKETHQIFMLNASGPKPTRGTWTARTDSRCRTSPTSPRSTRSSCG